MVGELTNYRIRLHLFWASWFWAEMRLQINWGTQKVFRKKIKWSHCYIWLSQYSVSQLWFWRWKKKLHVFLFALWFWSIIPRYCWYVRKLCTWQELTCIARSQFDALPHVEPFSFTHFCFSQVFHEVNWSLYWKCRDCAADSVTTVVEVHPKEKQLNKTNTGKIMHSLQLAGYAHFSRSQSTASPCYMERVHCPRTEGRQANHTIYIITQLWAVFHFLKMLE